MSAVRTPRACRLALALAAAWAVGTALPAQADTRASRFYEDAQQRYEKRDLDGAVIQLKNALQADRNLLAAHVLLGRALLEQGDSPAAEVALGDALRLGVDRAEVVVPLAQALLQQGKPQALSADPRLEPGGLPARIRAQLALVRASAAADLGDVRAGVAAIEEARALDPQAPESWLAEVPVRLRAREFDRAAAAADRAVQLSNGSAEALYMRATVSHLQGDVPAALAQYDKALRASPVHVEALLARAGLRIDRRQWAEANADVEAVLRVAPNDPRGHYLQGLLAEQRGDAKTARAALNRITALLDPVPLERLRYRPQVLMLGGLAHYGLQQREKALPYLEAALRVQPGSPIAKAVAQIHLSNRNVDRAVEALEQYLRQQPRDAQARLLLASAQMEMGRHARATQLMQEALAIEDRADLRTMLGLSQVGGGRLADALKTLEQAYRQDPTRLQTGVALGTLYLQGGQGAQAARVARELAQRWPRSPGVQNLLGTALEKTGDLAGARSAYEAAVRLDASFVAPQVGLARLQRLAGRPDAAEQALRPLLARNDRDVEVLSELARVAEARGRFDEAERSWRRAEDLSGPNDVQAGLALIDLQLRQRRAAAARETVQRLSGKAPSALPVLMATARVALAQGDAPTARSSLSRAAGLVAYNAPALLRIALMQVDAGHFEGAAHSLGKALSEQPGLLPAQALLAEVELRLGDLAQAEKRAKGIVEQQPKLAVGHSLLGDIAWARGQRQAAVDAYRRAHQLEPGSTSLLRLHGVLAVVDPAAAQQLAQQWLRQRPDDRAVRRAYADALARAGQLPAARTQYEALVKAKADDVEAMNNLANVLLLLKDPTALQVAERALVLGPTVPHVIGTAGWAAFVAGQKDRALQLLRDARLRDPANPQTRYYLAQVLADAGRRTEARSELETALKSAGAWESAPEARALLARLQ